jgi:tRNA(Ile)-lysidine synthase
MESPLIDKLKRRWPTERWRGLTIVLGCSGGADSTALLLAICQLKPADTTVVVAHFNHQLRGAESDEDQRFVEALAGRLGCPFVGGMASALPLTISSGHPLPLPKDGERGGDGSKNPKNFTSEAWLRDLRYRFLQRTAEQQGARYVAVAHTADDGVETTLHNLARGTGLAGLTGIATYRDLNADLVLIRPLIDVWRDEVVEYLAIHGQDFRHDSSNTSHSYTRNRIRHRWLPMLDEDLGNDTRKAIRRSSSILAEIDAWLDFQAREWLDRHTIATNSSRVELLPSPRIDLEWPVVQRALTILWMKQSWPLMAMTHAHWCQLRDLFQSPLSHSTVIELPSRIRVTRVDNMWIIGNG